MFDAPHGAVCAAVLPHAMAANVEALRARAPESPALGRYHEIARLLTGRPQASIEDGLGWVAELCGRLEIPPLLSYGVKRSDLDVLVGKAAQASSMKANPISLTPEELRSILEAAL